MMEQWNLQVQHQLPQSVVVSAAYVGAAGRHLVSRYNLAKQLFNTLVLARISIREWAM